MALETILNGNFPTSLDSKGRFVFPLSLRESLGKSFYVTKGPGKFLVAYSEERWKEISDAMARVPADKREKLVRIIFGNAEKRTPDGQGRVVITAGLRNYAGLSQDIVICGANNRVEIWDEALWTQMSGEAFTPEAFRDALVGLDLCL